MGLDYFPMILFDTVPRLYAELEDSIREVYPASARNLPDLLRFGSWIGGDRDGNPFVTAESTRLALQRARALVLDHYIAEVFRLSDQLSPSVRRVGASERLLVRLQEYTATLGQEYSRWLRISGAENLPLLPGFRRRQAAFRPRSARSPTCLHFRRRI